MTDNATPGPPEAEVLLDVAPPLARVTINRPERRNALSPEVVEGIAAALSAAEDDSAVRALVITGAGEKAFCAGGDLAAPSDAGAVAHHFRRAAAGELFGRLRSSRLPVVARVNGHALGGGFGLLLACDLVVAVDDAAVGTPEIDIGLWPFMISALIHRDLPRKVALELMLTGGRMSAGEGKRWGFVNRVVSREELDSATEELASAVASKSPAVVELGKRSFYRAEDQRFEDAVEYLSGMLSLCLQTEDALEGISAFLGKRPPEWKGR